MLKLVTFSTLKLQASFNVRYVIKDYTVSGIWKGFFTNKLRNKINCNQYTLMRSYFTYTKEVFMSVQYKQHSF